METCYCEKGVRAEEYRDHDIFFGQAGDQSHDDVEQWKLVRSVDSNSRSGDPLAQELTAMTLEMLEELQPLHA